MIYVGAAPYSNGSVGDFGHLQVDEVYRGEEVWLFNYWDEPTYLSNETTGIGHFFIQEANSFDATMILKALCTMVNHTKV